MWILAVIHDKGGEQERVMQEILLTLWWTGMSADQPHGAFLWYVKGSCHSLEPSSCIEKHSNRPVRSELC